MAKKRATTSRKNNQKPRVDFKVMVLIGIIALAGAGFAMYGSMSPEVQVQKSTGTGIESEIGSEAGKEPDANVGIKMESGLDTSSINVPIILKWSISSDKPGSTQHTSVHYGKVSVPAPSSPSDYGFSGKVLSGDLPGNFSDSVTIQEPGIYYMRAHTVVEGRHFWDDEKTLIVLNPSLQNSIRTITLSGGDNDFIMNNEAAPATIPARFGENLRVKFKTPSKSMDPEGMTYRSDIYNFDTGNVGPGSETEVEFTAYLSGLITSHRTSTNELVGTIFVTVE